MIGMIRGMTGNPGDGKTLECVTRLILDLVHTDRFVVTNLEELLIPELNAYLQQTYPKRHIDLESRLLVIPKSETFEFYRYRSGGLILPKMPDTKDAFGKLVPKLKWMQTAIEYFKPMEEKAEYLTPVTYILSEAHEYFPAREWANIGRGVTFYASKHRHLHDEIILETQYPMQIDSALRMLVQEWYVMVNRYKRSIGLWKQRGGFERRAYFSIPTPTTEPFEVARYPIDLKIANCYRTTGALGIMNRGPESSSHARSKKLPYWTMWALGIGATLLVMLFLVSVPRIFNYGLSHLIGGAKAAVSSGIHAPSSEQPSSATNRQPVIANRLKNYNQTRAIPVQDKWEVDDERPSVTVESLCVWPNNSFDIVLSTGQWITSRDGLVKNIYRNYVEMKDGQCYWISANVGRVIQPGADSTSPTLPVNTTGKPRASPSLLPDKPPPDTNQSTN